MIHTPRKSNGILILVDADPDIDSGNPCSGRGYYQMDKLLNSSGLKKSEMAYAVIPATMTVNQKSTLANFVRDLDPNIVMCMGDTVAKRIGFDEVTMPAYRGSILECLDAASPFYKRKCLFTFRNSQVNTRFEWLPLFQFDILRLAENKDFPELRMLERTYETGLSTKEVIARIDAIPDDTIVSIDIEGGVEHMSCMSIATSETYAFCVELPYDLPLADAKARILAINRMCKNPRIGKILQNALYDCYVLAVAYKIFVRNVVHDTMLSCWELYPELPKALGTQVSLWTDAPAYKYERKMGDLSILYNYCCKDAAYTFEIARKHREEMDEEETKHFMFNMQMLPLCLYMCLKGISYDKETEQIESAENKQKIALIEDKVKTLAGVEINMRSPKQVNELFYDLMGLPPQHPKVAGRLIKTKLTSGADARLALITKTGNQVVSLVHQFARLAKKQSSYLDMSVRSTGRIHASYNVVGTKTGRMSCSKSSSGDGLNLQTIPKDLRKLYRADPGKHFCQVDLAGADGWTVACRCAELGDDTMLLDYQAGIKPAKVIALCMREGRSVARLPREELAEACKTIGEGGDDTWIYFASKQVQHGSNYLLGAPTMSSLILKQSEKYLGKLIQVSPKQCKELQSHYFYRYWGVKLWHDAVLEKLKQTRTIISANGHSRYFFGRLTDNSTLRDALAEEPQSNTTYLTNLAMLNLWNDPENVSPSGGLIIEPLHQVHDAACVQFDIGIETWFESKMREYFNNPITIGNHTVTVAFDGGYGPNWKQLNTEFFS